MCQEHTFVEVVGEAGVVAGAAPAAPAAARLRSGHRGGDRREPLGLAQLLDQEAFVTALLGKKKAHFGNQNDDLARSMYDEVKRVNLPWRAAPSVG